LVQTNKKNFRISPKRCQELFEADDKNKNEEKIEKFHLQLKWKSRKFWFLVKFFSIWQIRIYPLRKLVSSSNWLKFFLIFKLEVLVDSRIALEIHDEILGKAFDGDLNNFLFSWVSKVPHLPHQTLLDKAPYNFILINLWKCVIFSDNKFANAGWRFPMESFRHTRVFFMGFDL
jgi:hypothetical protein